LALCWGVYARLQSVQSSKQPQLAHTHCAAALERTCVHARMFEQRNGQLCEIFKSVVNPEI